MELDPLRADCGRCAGLCCVVPAFAASADFAIDKPAGTPCRNLQEDFRCGIHADLRERGFPGCTVYDCFGAGQRVVGQTFHGRDWRTAPEVAEPMFAVFPVVRLLHELLWYLADAQRRPEATDLLPELDDAYAATDLLAGGTLDDLLQLDVEQHRQQVNVLLRQVSKRVRSAVRGARRDHRGADLIGADLAGRDLRGADLRGTLLIGARLAGADLGHADLIGADLRAADLRGARLADALFLTQFQANAAVGDATTVLPPALARPAHWGETPARRRR